MAGPASSASRALVQRARSRFFRMLAASLLASLGALPASAQDNRFPNRPVRIVIPTAPGGNMDLLARVVAEKLTLAWGQPAVVEPRPGANGMIAAAAVAKSAPDGYTVLFTISAIIQNLLLQPNPPYRLEEFTPVSMVALFPIAYAMSTSVPVDNIADFLAYVRQRGNKLSYGSYGTGSGAHVIGEGLNRAAGIQLVHVPYKGEAASYPDLASGQLVAAYGSVGFYARQVGTGKVKLLAVASTQRLKNFPDVPTFAQAGFPGVNLPGWGGMFLPAGTPPEIVARFVQEVRAIVAMPDVQARIHEMGFEPVGNSSEAFAQYLKTDMEKWSAVIRENNIKLD